MYNRKDTTTLSHLPYRNMHGGMRFVFMSSCETSRRHIASVCSACSIVCRIGVASTSLTSWQTLLQCCCNDGVGVEYWVLIQLPIIKELQPLKVHTTDYHRHKQLTTTQTDSKCKHKDKDKFAWHTRQGNNSTLTTYEVHKIVTRTSTKGQLGLLIHPYTCATTQDSRNCYKYSYWACTHHAQSWMDLSSSVYSGSRNSACTNGPWEYYIGHACMHLPQSSIPAMALLYMDHHAYQQYVHGNAIRYYVIM